MSKQPTILPSKTKVLGKAIYNKDGKTEVSGIITGIIKGEEVGEYFVSWDTNKPLETEIKIKKG